MAVGNVEDRGPSYQDLAWHAEEPEVREEGMYSRLAQEGDLKVKMRRSWRDTSVMAYTGRLASSTAECGEQVESGKY